MPSPDPGILAPSGDLPPLSPLLSSSTIFGRHGRIPPSALDEGSVTYLAAGRMAFATALELLGIGEGDEVLLPAFISRSMITPICHRGAGPAFYRIGPDLRADIGDIASRIRPPTRILVGVNYFGFPQPWADLRRLADDAGLVLIEDCAHSLFGTYGGRPVGSFGDMAIVSLPKFLPVWDGGALRINRGPLPTRARRRLGLRTQAKAVMNLLEESQRYRGNAWLANLLGLAKGTARLAGFGRAAGGTYLAGESLRRDNRGDFDPSRLRDAPAWISLAVTTLAARARIGERRRANYARLTQDLASIPGISLPLPLIDGVVPYMLPIRVADLDNAHTIWLKQGLPMQRFCERLWPEIPIDHCRVTEDFARHLVQFPCHQDLAASNLFSLARSIRRVLEFPREGAIPE